MKKKPQTTNKLGPDIERLVLCHDRTWFKIQRYLLKKIMRVAMYIAARCILRIRKISIVGAHNRWTTATVMQVKNKTYEIDFVMERVVAVYHPVSDLGDAGNSEKSATPCCEPDSEQVV